MTFFYMHLLTSNALPLPCHGADSTLLRTAGGSCSTSLVLSDCFLGCPYTALGSHQIHFQFRKRIFHRIPTAAAAFWPDSARPAVEDMESIESEEQFDIVLRRSLELSQLVLVDWMAAWCRKCIYLKPKLEKLAADYQDKIKFYCVDVNKVSQALVKRGNIWKMPTIQVWKDGEMKAEVIGGHKAWMVIEEVKEMISKYV